MAEREPVQANTGGGELGQLNLLRFKVTENMFFLQNITLSA